MIFNSFDYFFLLLFSIFVFYLLKGKGRLLFLALVSLGFYAYSELSYLLLISGFVVVNYFGNTYIEKIPVKKDKKRAAYSLISFNILILIIFKYLTESISDMLSLFGMTPADTVFSDFRILLPIGLSFYTFQTIGYTLDIVRHKGKAEKDFLIFSNFILFFPKLLVGPIERGKTFIPQLKKEVKFNPEDITEGLKRICWGLFKKLVISDRIALYTDAVFSNTEMHNSSTMIVAVLLYTFQLYTDFSGYTDIAIGSARLFSFKLLENFNRPFFASSIAEFWRRWHISLSSWVNDYLYNPTAYKRRDWGQFGVFYALFFSFLIIGIWHGATITFVIFGVLQTIFIFTDSVTRDFRKKIVSHSINNLLHLTGIFFTFISFSFSLIFFRANTLDDAIKVIDKMLSFNFGPVFYDSPAILGYMASGIILLLIWETISEYKLKLLPGNMQTSWLTGVLGYAILIIIILMIGVFDGGQFIYFKF